MNGCRIPHFGLKRQHQNLKNEILEVTDQVLSSGQLVAGNKTKDFENWLKSKTKTKYAITVHSGTQALEIIAQYKYENFKIYRVDSIPTIRIPNLTYPATLNAFKTAGWNIELSDTDKFGIIDGTQPSQNEVEAPFVCLVGLYGKKPLPGAHYSDIYSFIVDGAQHWLVADGDVGSGMAISFDPTKNLPSSGNGGAIVTNDLKLYNYAIRKRDNDRGHWEIASTNSRMSELDCAHLLVRAKYIDIWQKRRAAIANYWCDSFKNLPLDCLNNTKSPHAHQKFVVYLDARNSLHTHCMLEGIETKIHYEYVLGDLPIAATLKKPDLLSTSVMLSRGVLSLPLYPELSDEEVEYIADKIIELYDK